MAHADTVLVFFVYGLASFTMGLIVLVELRRARASPLASSLRFLAAFGLLHGAAQWLVMASLVKTAGVTVGGNVAVRALFLVLSALSALALLRFGSQLLAGSSERMRWARWVPWSLMAIWLLSAFLPATAGAEMAAGAQDRQLCSDCHFEATSAYMAATRDPMSGMDIASRYLLFLPASLIAAAGLARQGARFKSGGFPRLARETALAAVALVASAVVWGLAVPPGPYPVASALNYATVNDRLGFAPQLLWVVAAGAVGLFVVRSLRIFEIEGRQQLREAVVEERERIGREMHDGLAQALGFVAMRSAQAEELLDQNDAPAARNVVASIGSAAQDAYRDVRASILELRSSDLVSGGLVHCLADYCEKLEAETGMRVRFEAQAGDAPHLLPVAELQLVRIAQEALANVRKHARAKEAVARLAWRDGLCVLSVSDDGAGFSASDVRRPGAHFGLRTMRERAQSLGGDLRVESVPGRGTTVTATIPHAMEAG